MNVMGIIVCREMTLGCVTRHDLLGIAGWSGPDGAKFE